MKIITYIICLAMLLVGCGNRSGHDHDHDHDGHDHGSDVADHHEHSPDEIVILPEQAEVFGLQVETIEPKPFDMVIKVSGHILAAQGNEITVTAPSNGIVSFARILAEGSAVKQGEMLFIISAQNMLDGDPVAKARLAYEQAEREYRRAESLIKDMLISQREYEQAHTNYMTAEVTYNALSKSQTKNGIKVSAGMSGFIKRCLVAEGEYVTSGQPLVTVSQNRRLQLRCDVPERYYHLLPHVTSANFKTPYNDELYQLSDLKGRLLSFGHSSDTESFYVPVTFEFDNTINIIPGMFVETFLMAKPMGNVMLVPLKAMLEEQGLYFVYIQTEVDAYKKQEVKPGEDNGRDVHILAGLKHGDRVVTQGAVHVKLAGNNSVIPEHSHSH